MIVLLVALVAFALGFVLGFSFLAWCLVTSRIERRRAARAGRLRVFEGGRRG